MKTDIAKEVAVILSGNLQVTKDQLSIDYYNPYACDAGSGLDEANSIIEFVNTFAGTDYPPFEARELTAAECKDEMLIAEYEARKKGGEG